MEQHARSAEGRPYHGILLVLDRLDRDLGEEVVVEHVCGQMRLDGQTFREELLVEVLARLLAHQHATTPLVFARATSTTHHLQHIHDRVVDVAVFLAFVELDAHDDDHVAGNRETPRSVLEHKLVCRWRL